MSRLAVTRAEAPAVIRPRATALGLRAAAGAAALARSLMARHHLAGTWPADAELQVLTPPIPGAPPAPARIERPRAAEPSPPLYIRLTADIRLIRRLLAERAPAAGPRQRPGRAPAARTEVRFVEASPRPGQARPDRPARSGRTMTARPDRWPALPGPAVIRMPAPASETATSSVTVLRPIHTQAATETRSLLVIRSLAPAEPPTAAPVLAVRAPAQSRPETPGREGRGPPNTTSPARGTATATLAVPVADAARPAPPPASEAIPLEIVRRDAASPEARGVEAAKESAARERPLASRTRAVAARLAAERTPKLAVRSRRGPGPGFDRRTLAGRPAPSAPRITPIIPRAGQPGAAGEPTGPTRVVARRVERAAAPARLEGAAMLDSRAAPAIAQPAATRQTGAPTLTPASPLPSPGAPGPRARGDQRRQAVALEVRRAPVSASPLAPAPAAREVAEPRGKAGQRAAEDKAKPVKLDAPTLRKALNDLPIGEFEPLADRLIAEFEWRVKRGLERSGRL